MHARNFAARLSSRGVVQVSGPDSLRFLQGLVTNDVQAICGHSGVNTSFSAFLNGRGRVLFAGFMHYLEKDWFLVDIPSSAVGAFIRHLKQFKLRAKVHIDDVSDQHSIWSIIGEEREPHFSKLVTQHGIVFDDPRLPELGQRAIFERSFPGFRKLKEEPEDTYEALRILSGVPDGSDFEKNPLPLDLAIHFLNGVSFTKGCYLGQELTARTHHTGVLRKRIAPVIVTQDTDSSTGPVDDDFEPGVLLSSQPSLMLAKDTEIFVDSRPKAIGKISSSISNVGLAVVRLDDAFTQDRVRVASVRLGDGRMGRIWMPSWWDQRDSSVERAEN